LVVLADCWPAFGQKPAANSTSPAIKVTTHLVVLTVVVTDKKGKTR